MNNFLLSVFMPLLPKRLLSRLTGCLARIQWPRPLALALNSWFARAYRINLEEAEKPLSEYPSLNAFFTRRLKPGVRPLQGEWVHPCDAMLTVSGPVRAGRILQVKGWEYSVAEFLGDVDLAKSYEGGHFATYYLCPTDYHRVHAPLSGELISVRHIPGALWPVNEWSVNRIRSLFCLNERVVMNFRSEKGAWSLVMVGATNVGQIQISADSSIRTNRWSSHASSERQYNPSIPTRVGSEIGIFNMGSTVVCIYSSDFSHFDSSRTPQVTRVGQGI